MPARPTTAPTQNIAIFWHRRDLRLEDNMGALQALQADLPVLPLFIFDKNILDKLEDKADKRVQFIHENITRLHEELGKLGSSLLVQYGKPIAVWKKLIKDYSIKAVYTNRDYEPYAKERDKAIYELLTDKGIPFKGYKDHVIFDKDEVLKNDGKPYTVYTPYSRKWRAELDPKVQFKSHPNKKHFDSYIQCEALPLISLKKMGFESASSDFPSKVADKKIIQQYGAQRDFPGIRSTTRLGIHLRFGTISIRQLAKFAQKESDTFLNELIWRDFYHMILHHFPHAAENSFKPKYDAIPWVNNEEHFKAWCEGKTGYPMVDAGMRELNATGFMHNRVRMITASFLVKHLLTDWRWGEAYFAQKLLDFDLAANNGGWQWAASSGCDAAPYFRIFNPTSQLKKFDKDLVYVKQWIPEFGTDAYPEPIVEHKFARQRALDTYKATLDKAK